ncbi:MAG: HEPN domain-containing protein [Thermofilaceae archaeon]
MDKNIEEGLRWLDQAEADLKTAKDCLKDGNYYAAAFFAQQAAEKALEGFLYSKGYQSAANALGAGLGGRGFKARKRVWEVCGLR